MEAESIESITPLIQAADQWSEVLLLLPLLSHAELPEHRARHHRVDHVVLDHQQMQAVWHRAKTLLLSSLNWRRFER